MALNPKIAALTSINEAILALDYKPTAELQTNPFVDAARETLMEARGLLTDKLWPEMRATDIDVVVFEAWHSDKASRQRKLGLL